MPGSSTTVSAFMRSLLIDCIGTVMIEPEHWECIPESDLFDRRYFNGRLKHSDSVNDRTQKRLMLVFSYLLDSQKRMGQFQESHAVDSANALISLFHIYFDTDFSIWRNSHARDNQTSRTHLLRCLDTVLTICTGKTLLPVQEIKEFLHNYLRSSVYRRTKPLPLCHALCYCFRSPCAIPRRLVQHLPKIYPGNHNRDDGESR